MLCVYVAPFLDDCIAADSGISSGWLNYVGQGKYPTEALTTAAESQLLCTVHPTHPPQHF